MRGATQHLCKYFPKQTFQSTLPIRGATLSAGSARKSNKISIHTPHTGSDKITYAYHKFETDFNPHSPCGERHYDNSNIKPQPMISIHTPHAGSDNRLCTTVFSMVYFNPHSPCGERPETMLNQFISRAFQSTLPMRGATPAWLSFTVFS